MNHARMIAAAEWMLKIHEAGDGFDLGTWRRSVSDANTYAAQHKCGATCCFAGWLAVSPSFRRAGGSADKETGAPTFNASSAFHALAAYFDIDYYDAELLAEPWCSHFPEGYGKPSKTITPLDVVDLLLRMVKQDIAA